MRILHILDHSIPLHSGYAFRTASLLREQKRLGWQTFQLTGPKQESGLLFSEWVDGWLFHRTPSANTCFDRYPLLREAALMRSLTQRLKDLAREVRPDILHAHSPVLNAIPALRVGKELGIPVVYEIRAFWEDAAVDHGTAREWGARYRLMRGLETFVLNRVNAITTICEGIRQDLIHRGIAANRITIIPNAVDVAHFSTGADPDVSLRESLGLRDKKVLGFIGSFYAYEGLDLLLSALPQVFRNRPDTVALLVGGGPQELHLKKRVKMLGLENKVLFTGRVPHDKIAQHYHLIDLFVYPRLQMRLTELVTPLKPLEAMAQGRLIVASSVGGHRELIRHQQTGILFEAGNATSLADAILESFDHPERGDRLRTEARRFVERERTWEQSVGRYCKVYQQLTAERN